MKKWHVLPKHCSQEDAGFEKPLSGPVHVSCSGSRVNLYDNTYYKKLAQLPTLQIYPIPRGVNTIKNINAIHMQLIVTARIMVS